VLDFHSHLRYICIQNINTLQRPVNALRKQAGKFRRRTATLTLSHLRRQQPLQAALVRLLPSLLLLTVCGALLQTLLQLPLWGVAAMALTLVGYAATNCQSFVASQRRKTTYRHLMRACLLHAG
jgi:Flp pilus assembly protein TadB